MDLAAYLYKRLRLFTETEYECYTPQL